MHTFQVQFEPVASGVSCSDTELHVELVDGRRLSVPLEWFPRLLNATPAQRERYELVGRGVGIHWPEVDEDISVENLLLPSSQLRSTPSRDSKLPPRPSRARKK